MLGLAQAVAAAVLGSLVVALIASRIVQDRLQGLTRTAALVLGLHILQQFLSLLLLQEAKRILQSFVGRSLMGVLQRDGRAVRVYDGRINDPASLRQALDGVDAVIHLAGAEARDRVRLLQHVDVEGTERLLEEMRRAGVERLVLLSRLNAEPASMFALLRAKGQVERVVRQSGVPAVILRSATLYGRDDRFLNVITGLGEHIR